MLSFKYENNGQEAYYVYSVRVYHVLRTVCIKLYANYKDDDKYKQQSVGSDWA